MWPNPQKTEIVTFLSWLFRYVEKRLDKKAMVNFKIYDVADWTTNNYNTNIQQLLPCQVPIFEWIYTL